MSILIVFFCLFSTLAAVYAVEPTSQPSNRPSDKPSTQPFDKPSSKPTTQPFDKPSSQPSNRPVGKPTTQPFDKPSSKPSTQPSDHPSSQPSSQPANHPSSAPTYKTESWGEVTWDKKRHRQGGLCENHCSNHGTCEMNNNCKCFTGLDGMAEWVGPDCSQRTCPSDNAWVGEVVNANNLHPVTECSNKGICDRKAGTCACFPGYEGVACQRTLCPSSCNARGTCWPEKHLASKANRIYSLPWDAMKHVGCLCDAGYRGPACDLQECPSGSDSLDGYGNEAGRDCSGRGICDFGSGTCVCFSGFFGTRCQMQTTIF